VADCLLIGDRLSQALLPSLEAPIGDAKFAGLDELSGCVDAKPIGAGMLLGDSQQIAGVPHLRFARFDQNSSQFCPLSGGAGRVDIEKVDTSFRMPLPIRQKASEVLAARFVALCAKRDAS